MKTNKSFAKRVKVTANKKITKRRSNQSHFNAKDSGNITRGKRGSKTAPKQVIKSAKALLYNF